jgi:hypothetical protein
MVFESEGLRRFRFAGRSRSPDSHIRHKIVGSNFVQSTHPELWQVFSSVTGFWRQSGQRCSFRYRALRVKIVSMLSLVRFGDKISSYKKEVANLLPF